MKKIFFLLLVLSLLSACSVVVKPKHGGDFCPPGQAKKGKC